METEKHEWVIGQTKVTVEAPAGVSIDGLMVRSKPQDAAAFFAAVEAVGGLGAVTLPQLERPYPQAALAYPKEDGDTRYEGYVAIEEPPREGAAPVPAHPFFGPLAERQQREQAAGTVGAA